MHWIKPLNCSIVINRIRKTGRTMIHRTTLLAICALAVLLVTNGCEQENWNLVSPTTTGDSIYVRFINFSGDGVARTMSLDGTVLTQSTAFGTSSASVVAPADSAFVSIKTAAGDEYKKTTRTKFSKNSYETIIAVPGPSGFTQVKALDTIVQLSTLKSQATRTGYGNVRFLVAVNTVTVPYSLRIGCPNGNQLGSTTTFKQSTSYEPVPSGTLVVSLMKQDSLVGVFSVNVGEKMFYTLIAAKENNQIVLKVLDESDKSANALTNATFIPNTQRTSFFRVVNFSRNSVDSVTSSSGTMLTSALTGKAVDKYVELTACQTGIPDRLQVYSGSSGDTVSTSIGVLSKYTVVTYDKGAAPASGIALVPPIPRAISKDSVYVRVVNATQSGLNIRARLGARTDANNNFQNGEIVAQATTFGKVSNINSITAGYAPLTIFSSDAPEKLLGVYHTTLQAGKEYLFIVGTLPNGSGIEVNMIEQSTENTTMLPLPQGTFMQVVHARADKAAFDVSLTPVISKATIGFGASLATVVPQGTVTLKSGSLQHTYSTDSNNRLTVVLNGTQSTPTDIELNTPSMRPANDTARSRYLNAVDGIGRVRFTIDSVKDLGTGNLYMDNVEYGIVSQTRSELLPKRINLVVGNPATLEELYRSDFSVSFSKGKAYTVIFCGDAASKNYMLIMQQEY